MKLKANRREERLAFSWILFTGMFLNWNSLLFGQQPPLQNNGQRPGQSVAPPAAGYGNRPTSNTQPIATQNNRPSQNMGPNSNGGVPNASAISNGQSRGNGLANQAQQQPATPLNPNLAPAASQPLNPVPPGARVPGAGSGKEVVTADPYADKPLTPQEIEYVNQVLNYWEQSTANITQYACKFKRWQYNSSANFVADLAKSLKADIRNINTTVSAGEVRYMAPDKGMFLIDKMLSLTGQVANNKAEYKEFANIFGEWWLCDGEVVYEYDRNNRKCKKIALPPEMRGAAILDSPMPFVFGVKANKIKERYWVRLISSTDKHFVLEVYPKFQSDAVNYDHVHIYLDRKEFLPENLVKFNTGHVDKPGEVLRDDREIFEFYDREKNATLLQRVKQDVFGKSFIPFDIPKDWEVIEIPYAPDASEVRAANAPQPQTPPNNAPQNRR